jgi:aryl-alcohol dehydrogenase (NADP+)
MLPLCADQGIGVIPWSPLARGRLTRPWEAGSTRAQTDEFGKTLYPDGDRLIVEQVIKVAEGRSVPPAQIALAWVAGQPSVSAPIIGATKPHHIDDAVAALDIELTGEEKAAIEQHYAPHPVVGFS